MSALITETANASLDVVSATPTGARPDAVAINAITRRVYVSHDTSLPSDSFVTVLNADTNAVVTTIGVGKTAADIAVNQVTNRIYVANSDSNSISVIDGTTNSVIATVPVTPNAPTAVAVDEATNRFVVGTNDSGHVEVFSGATNTFVCASSVFQFPETVYSVAVNPTNGRIYAHYNPGRGAIVDGTTCGILLNDIPTCGGGHADQLIYNPTDNRFYGTNWNGSSIGGYSGSTGATVFCEGLPVAALWGTALNVEQQRLYATREHGNTGVWRMDIASPISTDTIDPGLGTRDIVFDPVTCKLFVAAHEASEVWIGSDAIAPNDCEGDGYQDLLQNLHRGPTNPDPLKDNCAPPVSNPTQLNTDGNFVDNSPPLLASNDDKTWPMSDAAGDACDTDADNDGLTDAQELSGSACVGIITDPLDRDSDSDNNDDGVNDDDRILDGAECALGTNPMDFTSKPTQAACGANVDTDGDKVKNWTEFCSYNTSNGSTDSDGDSALDGATDGCEVTSLNGDRVVNSGDQLLMVFEIIREPTPSERLISYDINKDGAVNSGDQLIISGFISPSGQCPAAQPDLLVQAMFIELQTGGACDYTSTQLGLRVIVQNAGQFQAPGFAVDGNGAQQSVVGLGPGAITSLWFAGYLAGNNSSFADATFVVIESNEANNGSTQFLSVPTLPPTCTPTFTPTFTPSVTPTPTPTNTPTATPT